MEGGHTTHHRGRQVFVLGITALIVFLVVGFVFAATFSDTTQTNFDAGTYSSTQWSTDHVELTGSATSGTFTSRVFDSGATGSTWDQLAWSETLTVGTTLYATDVSAQVWKSTNSGTTWTLVNADYNGADANGTQGGLRADSSGNLYAFRLDAVWRSTDGGANWTQRTTLFGSGSDVDRTAITSDGTLYIIAGNQGVWRSTDGGANWTQMNSDFNGGSGSVLGMTAVSTTLYAVDVAADVWTSTNSGTTWTTLNTNYNGADGDAGTDAMAANPSGDLFILQNGAIWRSVDSGVNWTQRTSNFGATTGLFMISGGNGTLYVVDGAENVWRSTDSGTNWTQMATNFNGGTGNLGGLAAVAVSTDITFGVREGNTNPPTGSFSGTHTTPGGSTLSGVTGQYFQYQATLTSGAAGTTPQLSSVTVTYTTPTPSSDTTAPAAVSDLAASGATTSTIDLSWTAPGDDGSTGTATTYDIRYSTSTITSGNFSSATAVTGEPTPSVAGSSETMTVSGLSANTTYFFAIKTSDEVLNTSTISNVSSLATLAGPTPTPTPTPTPVPSEEPPIVETVPVSPGGTVPTRIVFLGEAYPGALIALDLLNEYSKLLRNVIAVRADGDGRFSLIIDEGTEGAHFYSLSLKDRSGQLSTAKFYNYPITFNTIVRQQNIIFAPTMVLNRTLLAKTDTVTVSGYGSYGNTIQIMDGSNVLGTGTAKSDGGYSISIVAEKIGAGRHGLRARQVDEVSEKISALSDVQNVIVGAFGYISVDMNSDNRITIADWSIFLFNWASGNSETRLKDDLNSDGKVDVSDFSIFLTSFTNTR